MYRKEQLKFCKKCIHRKNDLHKGILCNLTNEKATFINNCSDFKIDTERVVKENQEENYRLEQQYGSHAEDIKNGKSTTWIFITTAFAVLLIGVKIIRFVQRNSDHNKPKQDVEMQRLLDDFNRRSGRKVKDRLKIVRYFSDNNRKGTSVRLRKDSVIWVKNKIKLKISGGYKLSTANKFEKPEIIADYKGYYFVYDKLTKDKTKTITEQWVNLRKSFSNKMRSNFTYKNVEASKINNIVVRQMNFTIANNYGEFYGVAKLVEIGNERYFFQFVFKQKKKDFNLLRKYLNRYAKVTY